MNSVTQAYIENNGALEKAGTPVYITAETIADTRELLRTIAEQEFDSQVLFVTTQTK